MTLIILHYVFQSESCWVPETLLHTAVSKDIEILVSPQVAGGLAGARGGQEQAQDGVWARSRAPPHRPHALSPGYLLPMEESSGLSLC